MSVVSSEKKSGDRRQEIVDAAVRIADAEGLEAVSMRRLAEELGVATMTPYTHVRSKDELIDLMRDEVAREMLVPEPLPSEWRPALAAIAQRTKDALEAHPWAFGAVARKPRGRINHMRHIEQSIRVARMIGLKRPGGRAVLMAVDDYVIGYCHRARARERMLAVMGEADAAADMRVDRDVDPEVAAALEAGELPLVKRLFGGHDQRHRFGVPPDSGFEPGLQWLLDGIEAEAARQPASRD